MVLWIIIFFVLLGPCLMLLSRFQNGNRSRIKIYVRKPSDPIDHVNRVTIEKTNHGQRRKRAASTSEMDTTERRPSLWKELFY